MNREIKFRAWNDGQMLYGYDLPGMVGSFVNLNEVIELACESGYVLMQYTGLKDKNGVPIYEGDIVRIVTDDFSNEYTKRLMRTVGRVDWVEEGCEYWVKLYNEGEYGGGIEFLKLCSETWGADDKEIENTFVEVIGNIYENPELLKHD